MQHIKFIGDGIDRNKGEIHFTGVQNDYTLCGYTMDGDLGTAGGYEPTTKRVNCYACIKIVTECKKVKYKYLIYQTYYVGNGDWIVVTKRKYDTYRGTRRMETLEK